MAISLTMTTDRRAAQQAGGGGCVSDHEHAPCGNVSDLPITPTASRKKYSSIL